MLRVSSYSRVVFTCSLLALAAWVGCVQSSGMSPESNGPDGRRIVEAPDLHDQYFPITSGAHNRADCNTCHGTSDSFTTFDCFACHDKHTRAQLSPTHTGLAGYSYDSPSCYRCHPRGTADGAISTDEHTRLYFPIATGTKHQDIACATCHVDPSNRRVVACINCHDHEEAPMATQHQGISGYEWTSEKCLSCHPMGQVNFDRTQHDQLYFLISSGTKHENVACESCHTNPNDRTHVECISCHDHAEATMFPIHDGISGYAWNDNACRQCHPKGEVNYDRTQHDATFLISAGTAHENVDCAGCHTDPSNRRHVECTSCHDHAQNTTDPIHTGIAGYQYLDSECRRCHPKGDVDYDRTTHLLFPIAAGDVHVSAACSSCHLSRTDRTQIECRSCHEHEQATLTSPHSRVGNYSWATSSCLRCHYDSDPRRIASHPSNRRGVSHGGFPSRCLQCHDRMQGSPRTFAADFTATNCSHNTAGCHED